jgi:uncharacterized phiE125 gp8 family phage protein
MVSAPVPLGVVDAGVAATKELLRIAGADEDALLRRLVRSALEVGEAFMGLSLIARTFEEVVPVTGAWTMLRMGPVTAITGVTGLPTGGAPFALPVAAYAVDIDADGRGWVRISPGAGAARAAVTHQAGLAASWDALPPALAQGTAALAAHLFEDRAARGAPPAAVTALWRPWRRMRLAQERRPA